MKKQKEVRHVKMTPEELQFHIRARHAGAIHTDRKKKVNKYACRKSK